VQLTKWTGGAAAGPLFFAREKTMTHADKRQQTGLTLVEYALVCVLISVAAILIVMNLGGGTSALYTAICGAVNSALSSATPCS
jgi:Flp pilus assembly pilin Flp